MVPVSPSGSRFPVQSRPRSLHLSYLESGAELHTLYRSPNIVRVIKSRRLRWAGHVARMEEDRSAFKILTGKPTGLSKSTRKV